MAETTTNEFRKNLKRFVDQTISEHEVLKVGRRNGENFVVIGEKDWKSIEETLYLNQYPGLSDSIVEAHLEPISEGTPLEDIDW